MLKCIFIKYLVYLIIQKLQHYEENHRKTQLDLEQMTQAKESLELQVAELKETLSSVSSSLPPSEDMHALSSNAESLLDTLNQEKSALVVEVEVLQSQIDQLKAQQSEMEEVYQTELREAGEVSIITLYN